ncbi:uncharacterized protein LOC114944933 [Nylanderia fulva]|uniref:uncharacterized protein LOC114944933 n=1 Tax=Nylanderia fulva TaxID=613905 RepID=UPI0010FB87A8|nr:uncharacterized protein LOC114944933 [Nylanderia fulva]
MAPITSLPEELIPIILGYKDITIEDIINFRCVCKQFRYAASYSNYMEMKFSQRRTGCDLTERYYHEKLFTPIRKSDIQISLLNFITLPDRAQLMEWIAFNVAQTLQIQKDVTYAYVVESLDNIALEVQNYLKKEHPDHSIFSTPAETFSYWKNNNIGDNHWNEAEGIQIIDALDEYIFGKLNFRPCKVNDTNLEYMCIDNYLMLIA